jgi:predicted nucleic acid-binding protein
MLKRQRLDLEQALVALRVYEQIPLRLVAISLRVALELVGQLNVFAYDAYMIGCALQYRCPLISLDSALVSAAKRAGATMYTREASPRLSYPRSSRGLLPRDLSPEP